MWVQSITNPVCGRHWDVIQDLLAPSPVLNSVDHEIAEECLPFFYLLTDKGLGCSLVNLIRENISANSERLLLLTEKYTTFYLEK